MVSGTSLAVVASTASVSALTYTQHGCIDFVVAGLLAPAAMMAAPLGALATKRMDNTGLKRILGYFLYVVAVLVPLKVGAPLQNRLGEDLKGFHTARLFAPEEGPPPPGFSSWGFGLLGGRITRHASGAMVLREAVPSGPCIFGVLARSSYAA